MFLFTPDSMGLYRPINLSLFLKQGTKTEQLSLLITWLLSVIASIYLGWASVVYDWYRIPFSLGASDFTFTLYPPLPICLLWVMLCGYLWGAIPSYLSTLTLAIYTGMPIEWALLFAFSNPLGLAVFSIVYRALPIQTSLRKPGPIFFFTFICLFSAIISSAGSFIWSHTNQLDSVLLFSIWQGWWFGGFVQQLFIVGPILFASVLMVDKLKEKKAWSPAIIQMTKRDISLLSGLVVVGVLLFIAFSLHLNHDLYNHAIESKNIERVINAYHTTLQSLDAVYWIMGITLALVVMLSVQFFILWTKALEDAKEEAELLARYDYLTGLYNRRAFFEFARAIDIQANRYERPYSLSLMDLDYFKSVNDNWGHDVGDAALKALSQVMIEQTREVDVLARFGGEEFVLLMPDTDLEQARITAERIRKGVENHTLRNKDGEAIQVTISSGLASQSLNKDNVEDVINRADEALYKAKESGRNKVEG